MTLDAHTWAWLILRVSVAWLFLMPVYGLIKNWEGTRGLIRLVSPVCVDILAVLCVVSMVLGALSVLLGVYAQIGGVLLFVYNAVGIRVHYQLANTLQTLGDNDQVQALGMAGHVSSGQKNVVLAAVSLFFVLMGSGPMSLY